MDNNTFDRLNDFITAAKDIAVILPQNPDFDTTGAGLALYLSLIKEGKKVQIYCPTLPTVALGNLVGVNKIKQGFETNSKGLVISLPYQQGAIEKISYDIVGDRINLTVVPGPQGLAFTTDEIVYQSPSGKIDLVFAIHISSEGELGAIGIDLTSSDVVNIDYNPENTGYGTVALVDLAFSSTAEIVTNLLSSLNLPMDLDIAQNLLSGIVEKTNNFQKEDTSASAFELAGLLIQKGARRQAERLPGTNQQRARQYQPLPFDVASPINPAGGPMQPFPPLGQGPVRMPRSPMNSFTKSGSTSKGSAPMQTQEERGKTPQPPGTLGAGKSTAKTPKDWFEPRIYKGSTPVS